ncbi:MAG: acyltransferase family protein [Chthoniobacteraceae bacterium]
MRRVAGLDSIRFFCALTVIFFHGMSPPVFPFLSRDTPAGRIILGLYDAAFNGQAAVLTFFIISGFCIHFPYASGRPFATIPFLLARAVRILVPTCAYLFLLRLFPFSDPGLKMLLWSIWCELIYYALYPVLRLLFARTSVFAVLLFSYAVAAGLIVWTLATRAWPGLFSATSNLTWLAGLPCWILGCHLAEHFSACAATPRTTAATVWGYRAGAVGLGSASFLAMLHLHVSFLISLHLFTVFAWFWIRAELRWYSDKPANRLLEGFGSLTFSIYLMHMLAICTWRSIAPVGGFFMWAVEMGFILLLSVFFYFSVEFPSHKLAQMLSLRPGKYVVPILPETSIL